MIPLREAIELKHREAERKPFNVRMLRGELSSSEYLMYLYQLYEMFAVLERHELPHPSLYRMPQLIADIKELSTDVIQPMTLPSTHAYCQYLMHLSSEQILPHIYLHYLALLYGGQTIKTKVPGSGTLYHVDDWVNAIQSIRAIQRDEWGDEANAGLDYFMRMLDELQNLSGSDRQ